MIMMSMRACISTSLTKACGNASFQSGDRWIVMNGNVQWDVGPGCGLKQERASGRAISLPGW